MKLGPLQVGWGEREWELQAVTESGYLHWSGPPFLTRGEAKRGLAAWRSYAFFSDVRAMNVRTGERLNP